MSLIEKLENEIEEICANGSYEDLESDVLTKLIDRLQEIDPYNDMFHLACKSWPNCEEEGCCES